MAQAIDVLRAQLVRSSTSEDWGIRLQGGADIGSPLSILRVTPGSPAHRIGLANSDNITYIEDTPTTYLKNAEALNLMLRQGDTMVLTVERKSWGRAPTQPLIRSTAKPQPKFYQTMDLTGAGSRHQPQSYHSSFEPATYQPEYPPAPHSQPQQAAYVNHKYNGHSHSTSPPYQPTTPSYQQQPSSAAYQHPSHAYPSASATYQAYPSEDRTDNKFYQTYDLNGPRHHVPANPQTSIELRIAKPRLFEAPVRPPHIPPSAPQQEGAPPQLRTPPRTRKAAHQFSPPPPNVYRAGPVKYIPEEDKLDDETSQSRTFKILRSLMANEEPYSGVEGLPPPRSAEMERMKEDFSRQNPKARVKVFMPQQYNSPMGMYSPENVMESFQTQAEGYFDDMDRKEAHAGDQTLSNTAQAVLEQEAVSASDF